MKINALSLLLHGLLGAITGSVLWIVGSALFGARLGSWFPGPVGFLVTLLIGVVSMNIGPLLNNRILFRINDEQARGIRVGFNLKNAVGG